MAIGLYGIHPYDHDVTWEKKDRLAHRMGIADTNYLVLSRRYASRIEQLRGKAPDARRKVFYQPLQLRWYSSGGRAQWLVPNCDVGGFPNLKWQQFGLPDTLIGPMASREYADSAWTMNQDLTYMTLRYGGQQPQQGAGPKGHLLVFWSYFMGRQSVRLVGKVEKWRRAHGDGIEVKYVNVDSLMMGVDKPELPQ